MKKIKSIIFLILALSSFTTVFAQQKTIIRGRVIDNSDKTTVIGANVVEYDKEDRIINGTITNVNGDFVLTMKDPTNIVKISVIGYKQQEIKVDPSKTIIVALFSDDVEIGEVKIVAQAKAANSLTNIEDRDNDSDNEHQYGPPLFNEMELSFINQKKEAGDLNALAPPHKAFRNMFTPTPQRVARIGNRIRGFLPDGTEVKIPGAFADWPPDDKQPAWSDVTYLRLYDHKDFNYIAYNTVRMYDRRLAVKKKRAGGLWEYIVGIIPYYQEKFGIDGVMID
ncbi:MAG: carboxypeptidase-like regulatory domain-containing protein, partial [Draconibacterium sp.]|nr:carboxypeptidase-like regulatory domain-containing protein [Draconibacterium sp.]